MHTFEEHYAALLERIGDGEPMVLSTSVDNQVSSRMVSVIVLEGIFYFQTDQALRKYAQLQANPRAALCCGNVQIEGVCAQMGHPKENPRFSERYMARYPGSFRRYSGLPSERVFSLTPVKIKTWIYQEEKPYEECFDFAQKTYEKRPYAGGKPDEPWMHA